MCFRAALRLLLIVSACSMLSLAQSPLGTVTGLATDPTGAPIPRVRLELKNTGTGIQFQAETNDSGNYLFPNLPAGEYSMLATADGFSPLRVEPFAINAFATVRQDIAFSVSNSASEVTVSSSVSDVIQIDTPSVGSRLDARQLLNLPTNLRSIYNNSGDSGLIANIMPLTVPGVVQMGSGAYWLSPGAGPNGMRVKVDGIDTTFGNFGSPDPVSQPSMESVQEFTANLITNKAEFGGLSTVTSVTKAGTNAVRGSAFWIARNASLDARNAFQTQKPFQNLHNYGGSIGTPLKKDKTFFFGAYEGYRGVRAYLFNGNVPTLAWRNGDFGGAMVRDPYSNTPFPNNRIPGNRISPEALKAQSVLYPLPNFGASSLTTGNYQASFTGGEVHHIAEGRIDHYLSEGHSLFLRYQYKKDDYAIPGAREGLPPTTAGTSSNLRELHFLTVGDTWSLTQHLFNEARLGGVFLTSKSSADVTGQSLLDTIGISGLPARPGAPGVPTFNVTGLTRFSQRLLNPVYDSHWQLADNLTWIHGRHTVKAGAQMIHWMVNRFQASTAGLYGNFTFQNRFTGQPYGDFLLGLPTNVVRIDPSAPQYFRWTDFAVFVQDDWKVSKRLTVSYGIRYELNPPAEARDENVYSVDRVTGSIIVPSDASRAFFSAFFPSNLKVITAREAKAPTSLRNTDSNNFAPRLGLSYLLDPSGKTVIRAGAGVYYASYSVQAMSNQTSGPYAISTTSNNTFDGGQPLFSLASPFATAGSAGSLNLNGLTADLANTYSWQWSFTVERELLRDLGLRISYIGTKGTQLPYVRDINQVRASTVPFSQSRRPFPEYNSILYAENGANNSYQGLQIGMAKRYGRGLQLSSTYIWAKELSEVDDTDNAELYTKIEDAYNRSRDRANVYSVPRHQWMSNVLYDLPLGRRGWVNGWQLNALLNFQSGNFLNPTFSGSDPSNTNTFGGRPDALASISYPGTKQAWFDRSSFGVPTQGRFGNAGRNTIVGPGYVVFNAGLIKTTKFESAGSLQLGISFQNLLNHVNLGQPNVSVNVAQGGAITSTSVFLPAQSARSGQFTARWVF